MAVKFSVPTLMGVLAGVEAQITKDYQFLASAGFVFEAAFLEVTAEHKELKIKDSVTLSSSVVTIMKHPDNTAITYSPALVVKDFLKTLKQECEAVSPDEPFIQSLIAPHMPQTTAPSGEAVPEPVNPTKPLPQLTAQPKEVFVDPSTAGTLDFPTKANVEAVYPPVAPIDQEFGVEYFKEEANKYKVAHDPNALGKKPLPVHEATLEKLTVAANADNPATVIFGITDVPKSALETDPLITPEVVKAAKAMVEPQPALIACMYPVDVFPVNCKLTPKTKVIHAEELLAPCSGTSADSVYNLVAKAGKMRLAARVLVKDTKVALSLRAEGASLEQKLRLKTAGFKSSDGSAHLSIHFDGTPQAVRSAYAALVLGCGIPYDEVILLGDLPEQSK